MGTSNIVSYLPLFESESIGYIDCDIFLVFVDFWCIYQTCAFQTTQRYQQLKN